MPVTNPSANNPLHSSRQPEYWADMGRARDHLTGLQYNHIIICVESNVRGTCDNHIELDKSRKENPQKLTQLSSRSHPRHLVGKKGQYKKTPS